MVNIQQARIQPFEWTIPFTKLDKLYPLVEVKFLTKAGKWIPIRLIFDTGSEAALLRPRYAQYFPEPVIELVGGAGETEREPTPVIKNVQIEFLSKQIKCDVIVRDLPCHSLVGGLFGRNCFKPFGFGFWENAQQIYVTLKP